MIIDCTLIHENSKKLDLIFEKQIGEGITEAMLDGLSDKIEPLLVKGDEAPMAEAHKIYVKALLDENRS